MQGINGERYERRLKGETSDKKGGVKVDQVFLICNRVDKDETKRDKEYKMEHDTEYKERKQNRSELHCRRHL